MIGELIGQSNERFYDHGCVDYSVSVIEAVSEGILTCRVIEAQSCHSCWQVGHDANHIYAEVGDIWSVKEEKVFIANWYYRADVIWVAR